MEIRVFSVVLLIIAFLCAKALAADINIALGKRASFDPPPNDSGCTDPDDALQLTDGLFAGPGFWIDKQCVGWRAPAPIHIILDLESVKPISGVSFSTAARVNAGVLWPVSLIVQVSDDGENYHYVCNLTTQDKGTAPDLHPIENDFRHVFRVDNLKTHGRFVAISAVTQCQFLFVDEIEIYKGSDEHLNTPLPGPANAGYAYYAKASLHKFAVTNRLMRDINILKDRLATNTFDETDRKRLEEKLQSFQKEIDQLPEEAPNDFKAILPINELEEQIFALNGEIWSLQKLPKLVMWKKHRYDRLDVFESPDNSKAEISISAMKNEYRADSVLLTNATEKPVTLTLTRNGLPENIEISAIPWTDTAIFTPVASALPELTFINNRTRINIPAGMTRKIWVGVHTGNLNSGEYRGSISVTGFGISKNIPVSIHVSKIEMNKPRLHLGVWDHTIGNGNRAITPANTPDAIRLMVSHHTDCPWTESVGLPREMEPTEEAFAPFDEWIRRWPDASYYMVFLNTQQPSYMGHAIETEEFNESVATWAKAVEAHLKKIDLDPSKVVLLLIDEPHRDEQDRIVAAWIKAIKASGVNLLIFQDPTWEDPRESNYQEAMTLPEIICPNLGIYHRNGKPHWDYYEAIRKSGNALWFYLCDGPVRNFDPSKYYRLTAWHAFDAHATGIGFWSFGDLGGRPSSWNEYGSSTNAYAPAFVDPETVIDSVHWNAVREGIQDYEYLAMLAGAASAAEDPELKTQAENLLRSDINLVVSDKDQNYGWKERELHNNLDNLRLRIISLLEKMQR